MTVVYRGLHFFKRAKAGSKFEVTSGDVQVDSGDIVVGGAGRVKGSFSGGGDINIVGHADGREFLVNQFDYPAPGTDWTRVSTGAYLAEGKAAKIAWLPLNFLKIGDEITSYKLVGNVMKYSGETNTLDCALQSANKATPATITAVTSGAIAQQTSGGFDVLASFAATTVATDKQYHLLITGTTGGSGHIVVLGAEVAVNRKV